MPLRGNPECLKCGTNESSIWTNAENLGAICLDCVNEAKDECKSDDENDDNKDEKSRKRTRTTRSYKTRLNPFALPKVAAPKGRDQYCEKSAIITWLLPTTDSPPPNEMFDPATYIIGPEEDIPRKLECMDFVMHAPSDYYKASNTPYPNVHPAAEPGFIWSSLKPIQRLWCQTT
ncbi:gata zinc finger domain-containing [Holotrichia oblita]|uniref:Gata zinc finger domain-containing n=1 Tax=Holotrichia oblita TaxID=644536 RepID=A0ACB9TKT4_HOLOL|nr:gata zinc finger domain-containing [Holotrichia oblita]